MKLRSWSIGLVLGAALAVSGCEAQPPAELPAQLPKARENAATEVPVMGPERRILAFGDSLFAGYGVEADESYPAKLEAAMRARGINANVSKAGVSGDTTAAGLQRFVFTLDAQEAVPELVIVELGGNDLLRGLPVTETEANLDQILSVLAERDIPALLMGMRAPPNLGEDYVTAFDGLYPKLAAKYGAELVPFFLEAVYDQPQLIQGDRIHPTAEGLEALVTSTVAQVAAALPEPTS